MKNKLRRKYLIYSFLFYLLDFAMCGAFLLPIILAIFTHINSWLYILIIPLCAIGCLAAYSTRVCKIDDTLRDLKIRMNF